MKFDINSPVVKKVLGIASAVVMGVVTVTNALSEQKKNQEFEEMKKTLSELQENKEGSPLNGALLFLVVIERRH